MTPPDFSFEYAFGKEAKRAYFDRSDIILRSIPDIDKRYAELQRRDLSELANIPKETRDEALDIYNRIVEDGRFVRLLTESPRDAVDRLGLRVSDRALETIQLVQKSILEPGSVQGPIEAVIAVAVVVAVAAAAPQEGYVIDQSAAVRAKL